MAVHGFDGVSVSQIVAEASIPLSSIYHYFGSKDGILLGVMERGARRFFAAMPDAADVPGSGADRLRFMLGNLTTELDRQPDFLLLVTVMTVQPPAGAADEAMAVVRRERETALHLLRRAAAAAFETDPDGVVATTLSRFALSTIDGTILAQRADGVSSGEILKHLPTAMAAMHTSLTTA